MSTDIPEDPVELNRAAEEAIRQIAKLGTGVTVCTPSHTASAMRRVD